MKKCFRAFYFPLRMMMAVMDIRVITEIRFYLFSKNDGVEYSKLEGDEKKKSQSSFIKSIQMIKGHHRKQRITNG